MPVMELSWFLCSITTHNSIHCEHKNNAKNHKHRWNHVFQRKNCNTHLLYIYTMHQPNISFVSSSTFSLGDTGNCVRKTLKQKHQAANTKTSRKCVGKKECVIMIIIIKNMETKRRQHWTHESDDVDTSHFLGSRFYNGYNMYKNMRWERKQM